jgi:flagellar motility protein MotE (MotC chaperone)
MWNRQLLTTKRELVGAENELRMLQETYNDKQDSWIKEKLDFQVSKHSFLT